jgi:hypothetical protein
MSGHFSFLIFDMRTPVMDGTQFRSAMLQIPYVAKIPAPVSSMITPASG